MSGLMPQDDTQLVNVHQRSRGSHAGMVAQSLVPLKGVPGIERSVIRPAEIKLSTGIMDP